MAEIFVSYRRADAAGTAGRLFDRLADHFGAAQVFRDIEDIEAGDPFERVIRDALGSAGAVLVVIGPRWLDAQRPDGIRRIDDPRDYVRREIEVALASDAVVIPVLVENAVLPEAERLPESIRELTRRNALELSHQRWESDVQALISSLERRGIQAERAGAVVQAGNRPESYQVIVLALGRFIPNLLSLIRQPRTFLRQSTQGGAADLIGAFIFFGVAVSIAIVILLSEYTPVQPALNFGLTVIVTALLSTIALSVPLWIAWRVVGATHHYSRVLFILLHQVAALHLIGFIAAWIILVGLDMRSLNVMSETIAEAMKPGVQASAAMEAMRHRLEPLAGAREVRVALGLGGIVLLAGAGWLVWSWRAYRNAFGLSRQRSIVALVVAVLVIWAGLMLIGLIG